MWLSGSETQTFTQELRTESKTLALKVCIYNNMSDTFFKSVHNEVDLVARVTECPIMLQDISSDAV